MDKELRIGSRDGWIIIDSEGHDLSLIDDGLVYLNNMTGSFNYAAQLAFIQIYESPKA